PLAGMRAVGVGGRRGGGSGAGATPPLWLKIAALSGLLMSLLYLALAIVPIIEVSSRWLFALKISGFIVAANLAGLAIFLTASRRLALAGKTE
ncbi:MAG TPA: hypothetical protein VH208_08225, partial [Myxococcaceae bacterium]|nr:hypothetical protein [Myxococcaceae bacterium]